MEFEWVNCFSYKISMLLISNDYKQSSQQLTHHNYPLLSKGILLWLRNEIIAISPTQLKTTSTQCIAQQFTETHFLIKLLLKINYQYFSQTELMDCSNSTGSKWKARVGEMLEKYVNYSQKKRFARAYRNVLLFLDKNNQIHGVQMNSCNMIGNNQSQSARLNGEHDYNNYAMNQQTDSIFQSLLLMLLLFLTTRSQNNQEFISRILTLPVEIQKQLQNHIEWVADEMLQPMTERHQLSIRFNELKEENLILLQNYQSTKHHYAKLIHTLQTAHQRRDILENTIRQNTLQKLTFLQSLPNNHPLASSSYTSIFRHSINTNSLLNALLQQKQQKNQQLLSLDKQINLQLDSFEGVLEELGKERKCVKRELNEKENESFKLEMRVSLQGNNDSVRKSSKFWNTDRSMRESDGNIQMTNTKRESLLLGNSHQLGAFNSSFTQINQSMNMLSKIQQLRRQKEELTHQLMILKDENKSLRRRDAMDQAIFTELSELYQEGLKIWGTSGNRSQVNGIKNSNLRGEKVRKMSNNTQNELDSSNKENSRVGSKLDISNKENNSRVGSNRLRKQQSRIPAKQNNPHMYREEPILRN